MKNPSLIFQNKFSGNSLKVIKKYFNIPEEDTVLFALWAGRLLGKPVRERGFVFTNRGLIWFFPVVSVSGENDENAERSQRDFDFLPKENIEFKLAYSKTDGITKELHLKTSVSEYIYIFPGDTSPEIISEIESIVRNYFTGDFDVNAYSEKVKKHAALLLLLNIPDLFASFGEKVKSEWKKFFGKIKDFFTVEKKSQKSECHTKQQTSSFKKKNKVFNFVRHVVDLSADFFYFAAVISLVKDGYQNFSIKLICERSFYFAYTFLILKIMIIFLSKKSQKTVSFLLILILGITTVIFIFPVERFFIGLVMLSLLILLTLQFSLGFSKRTIKIKIWFFVVIGLSLYIRACIVNDPNFLEKLYGILCEFVDKLELNVVWI